MKNLIGQKSNTQVVMFLSSLLLSLIIILTGYYFVIKPKLIEISKLNYSMNNMKVTSKHNINLEKQLKALTLNLETVEEQIQKQQKSLTGFSKDCQVNIITAFNKVITEQNLILKQQAIKQKCKNSVNKYVQNRPLPVPRAFIHEYEKNKKSNVKLPEKEQVSCFETVSYTYCFEGSFLNIYNALHKFGEIPYFFKVKHLSVKLLPINNNEPTGIKPTPLECVLVLDIMFPKCDTK